MPRAYTHVSNSIRVPPPPCGHFKELLTCHPLVESARIGQYHESDFGLIRAPDHTLYIQVPPADNLSKTVSTQIR